MTMPPLPDGTPPRRPIFPSIDPLTIAAIVVGAIIVGGAIGYGISRLFGGDQTVSVGPSHLEFNERLRPDKLALDDNQRNAPRPGAFFSSSAARNRLVSELHPALTNPDIVAGLRHADCLWIAKDDRIRMSWEMVAANLEQTENGRRTGNACIVDSIAACTYTHPVDRGPFRCTDDDNGNFNLKEPWIRMLDGNIDEFKVLRCPVAASASGDGNECRQAAKSDDCEFIPTDSLCRGSDNSNYPFCAIGCATDVSLGDATYHLEIPLIGANEAFPIERELKPTVKVVGSPDDSNTIVNSIFYRAMEPHEAGPNATLIGGALPVPDEVEFRWTVPQLADGRLVENFSPNLTIDKVRFFTQSGTGENRVRRELTPIKLGIANLDQPLNGKINPDFLCRTINDETEFASDGNCGRLKEFSPTYKRDCLTSEECGPDRIRWHAAFHRREGAFAEDPGAVGVDEPVFIEFALVPLSEGGSALTAAGVQSVARIVPGIHNFADPINGGPPAVGETRQAALNLTITGSGVIDLLELGVDGANASDFSAQIQ
ncbi:MAG: hypothetical protein KDJ16_07055, partial [Hyphomicrobiales bacterium]|nr:hypothetical protein [Hyphomicrobiales bacterium]